MNDVQYLLEKIYEVRVSVEVLYELLKDTGMLNELEETQFIEFLELLERLFKKVKEKELELY